MGVVFRADASVQIGTGHVMRCMVLAEELRRQDVAVSFICQELPGHICDVIESRGYRTLRIPGNTGTSWIKDAEQTAEAIRGVAGKISWLVVDHYRLDLRWETRIRPMVERIMVIDDLADRPHDCDLLLDQNLCQGMERRYDGLVPPHCTKLLGPSYVLLRREFLEARGQLGKRDGRMKRILIFFGGSDQNNQTEKALDALMKVNRPDVKVDVVVGLSNPRKEDIRQRCSAIDGCAFHCQVENMAKLMALADLAIGAGGTATWERCFLGLPAIVIVTADNQLEIAKAVAATGAIWNLGWYHAVSSDDIAEKIALLIDDPGCLIKAGTAAMAVTASAPNLETIINILKGKSIAQM